MRVEKEIGKYSKKQARKYLRRSLLFLIPLLALFLTSLQGSLYYIDVGKFEFIRGFLVGVCLIAGSYLAFDPYKTWTSGRIGERRVLDNLSGRLGEEFSIFNDVLLIDGKKGNIDHIVVGPTGLFVIETKNSSGKVTYGGSNWNPSKQVINNAVRVKKILQDCEAFEEKGVPFVKAILLFSNPKAKPEALSEDLELLDVFQFRNAEDPILADFIKNKPVCFSAQEICQIEQCLWLNIGNHLD